MQGPHFALCGYVVVDLDLHVLLSGDEATSLRVCIIHGVYTGGTRTYRVSSAAEAFICRGSFNCVSSVQKHRGHVVDQHGPACCSLRLVRTTSPCERAPQCSRRCLTVIARKAQGAEAECARIPHGSRLPRRERRRFLPRRDNAPPKSVDSPREVRHMSPPRRFVAILPRRPGGGAAIAAVASVGAAACADAATQTAAMRVPAPQRRRKGRRVAGTLLGPPRALWGGWRARDLPERLRRARGGRRSRCSWRPHHNSHRKKQDEKHKSFCRHWARNGTICSQTPWQSRGNPLHSETRWLTPHFFGLYLSFTGRCGD